MKNREVVEMFVRGIKDHKGTKNLHIKGGRLVNYYTTLAQWENGKLYINETKYSLSTSRIQSVLKAEVSGMTNLVSVTNQFTGVTNLV